MGRNSIAQWQYHTTVYVLRGTIMALSNEKLKATGSDDSFIELLEYIKVKYNLTVHSADRNIAYLSYNDGFEIGKLKYHPIVDKKYVWESPYTKGKIKGSNERSAKNVAGLKRSLVSAIISYENYLADLVKDISRGAVILENWARSNNGGKHIYSNKTMYDLQVDEWHALLQIYLEGTTKHPLNIDTYKNILDKWNDTDNLRAKQLNLVNHFYGEDVYVIGESYRGTCMIGELKKLPENNWELINFRSCTNDTLPEKLIGKIMMARIYYENKDQLTTMGLPSTDSNYNDDLEIVLLGRYGSTTKYYNGISWAIIKA